MKKRCLLITGTNPGAAVQVPVGLIYLASQLKKYGYPVEIFHVVTRDDLEDCKKLISSTENLFVGFSIWMGPISLDMIELSNCAKKYGIPTIWGGKFVTSIKVDALTEESVDIAVMGYAEKTIVELADHISEGKSLSEVAGIYYRDNDGKIIKTDDRLNKQTNLDDYDYDLSLIRDWSPYIVKSRADRIILDPLESQRGCLFRCAFCFHSDDTSYSASNKKTISSHSIDFIIKKAKQLKALTGLTHISFCDDEFWINENRSLEIIERLKDLGIKIVFIRIRFTSLNDNMLKRLTELSATSVACGLESGNARILKMMNKGLTLDVVKKKMELLAKYPIIVNTVIIVGSPTETKDEMLDSVRFMLSLRKIKKNLNILAFFYRPLPSTDFGKMAQECGFQMPHNIREWVNVSAENVENIGSQWLPWYDGREKKNMARRADFFMLNVIMVDQMYGANSNKTFVRILWPLLYLFERLSFKRIYYWNFRFPIDAKVGLFLCGLYKRAKYRINANKQWI